MSDIKRLNYFMQQFLVDTDFNDEQTYHREMRLRHNRALHTWGVADGGLQVTVGGNNKSVSVGAGMAIDNQGREIILLSGKSLDLSGFSANADVFITVRYQEDASDFTTVGGVQKNTRWTESPELQAATTAPVLDGSVIPLARVRLDGSGNVLQINIDQSIQPVASSKIAPETRLQVRGLSVSGDAVVNGKVGVGTSTPNYSLSFGSNLANTKLAIWDGGPGGQAFGLGVQGGQFRLHLNQASDRFSFLNGANGNEIVTMAGNGNVGIGKTNPGSKLDVNNVNAAAIRAMSGSASAYTAYQLGRAGVEGTWGVAAAAGHWAGDAAPGDLVLRTETANQRLILNSGSGASTLVVNNQKVGVGVVNPQSTLDINGDMRINDDNLYLRPGVDNNHGLGWHGAGKLFAGANVDGPVLFGFSGGALGTTNGGQNTALTWNAAGNVGIGTSSPGTALDVVGNGGTSIDFKVNGRMQSNNNDGGLWVGGDRFIGGHTTDKLGMWAGGAYRLTVQSNGNVGIGTTAPRMSLEVTEPSVWSSPAVGGSNGSKFAYLHIGSGPHSVIWDNASSMRFGVENPLGANYGERMRIQPDGKIGIGTSTPQATLDVNGPIYAGNSDIYFTDTGHAHTGIGNTPGWAAIENSSNYGALMILGRQMTGRRVVHVWDYLKVNGTLEVTGGKVGYIVDQFINNLDDTVEEGDVVVIREGAANFYYGDNNSIPVPEVDLAQKAYDSRVCGIVSEVHSTLQPDLTAQSEPSAKSKKRSKKGTVAVGGEATTQRRDFTDEEYARLDRLKVEPGQVGMMVTLGAFAHCKVDADIAPIKAGDLLTTSPTKGHAQKVLDPNQALGAIIGKAIGALAKGKGKIPVLVTLQ